MSDDQKPAERALDMLVYGPLGMALYVRDTVPTIMKVFVSRGRSELKSRRRQVGAQAADARSLGIAALSFAPDVRRRVEESLKGARELAEQAFSGLVVPGDGETARPERASVASTPTATKTKERDAANSRPSPDREARRAQSEALPIPDYDELSASQVVERLDGLPAKDLAAVRAYEEAHRGRRTILFKIDQLTS